MYFNDIDKKTPIIPPNTTLRIATTNAVIRVYFAPFNKSRCISSPLRSVPKICSDEGGNGALTDFLFGLILEMQSQRIPKTE